MAEAWESDFPNNGHYRIGFSLTLNDLNGGTATAKVYSNESGSFVPTGASVTYDGDDITVWEHTDLEYQLDLGGAAGKTAKVKVVVEYTYPDGISETLESEEASVHAGTFASVSRCSVSGTVMTVDVAIGAGVDLSDIDINDAYCYLWHIISDTDEEYISLPTPTVEPNGDHVIYTFNLSDSLESGEYLFDIYLYYGDWEGHGSETFSI